MIVQYIFLNKSLLQTYYFNLHTVSNYLSKFKTMVVYCGNKSSSIEHKWKKWYTCSSLVAEHAARLLVGAPVWPTLPLMPVVCPTEASASMADADSWLAGKGAVGGPPMACWRRPRRGGCHNGRGCCRRGLVGTGKADPHHRGHGRPRRYGIWMVEMGREIGGRRRRTTGSTHSGGLLAGVVLRPADAGGGGGGGRSSCPCLLKAKG